MSNEEAPLALPVRWWWAEAVEEDTADRTPSVSVVCTCAGACELGVLSREEREETEGALVVCVALLAATGDDRGLFLPSNGAIDVDEIDTEEEAEVEDGEEGAAKKEPKRVLSL